MNLRVFLRNEFSIYIRGRLVKNECEWCGEINDLHFHHIDRFHNLLNETLEELNLNELNTEEYNKHELNLISSIMLAKQIKSEYITLCEKCHYKLHSIEKNSDEYKSNYKNPFGSFIYFDYELFFKYDPAYVFRFLRLCCSINYNNIIQYGNGKNFHKNITTISQLKELLNLSDGQFYPTINYLIDNKFIELIEDGILVNKNMSYMGSKNNNLHNNTRIFKKTFTRLYESCGTKSHKRYCNLFKLLKNCNTKYNLITSSTSESDIQFIENNFLKISDFEKIIGNRGLTKNSIDLFTNTTLADGGKLLNVVELNYKKYYIINPSLIYNGMLNIDIINCYNIANS